MDKLTERGFVSIIGTVPYWIKADKLNNPWLYRWEVRDGKWKEIRQIAMVDVDVYMIYKVSEERAQIIHNYNSKNPEYKKPSIAEEIQNVMKITSIDPDFGKIKGSIIGMIRGAGDIADLKTILKGCLMEVTELIN